MARTDAEKVSAILASDPDAETLSIHIDDAHNRVETVFSGEDLDESTLERIERYLAAHSYKFLQDRQLEDFSRESSSGSFAGEFGEGLMATSYGQMAVEEDPTGLLTEESKPQANVSVLDSRGID